jgi:hypothetical protein
MAWNGKAMKDMAWKGIAWHGKALNDMALQGKAWHGKAWYGKEKTCH